MSISALVSEYLYTVDNRITRSWYDQKLRIFAEWCQAHDVEMGSIRSVHIKQFAEYLRTRSHPRTGNPLSDQTVKGYVQVVQGFLSYAAKEEMNKRIEISLPKVENTPIEVFSKEQLNRLFAAIQKEGFPSLRVRDTAILSTLVDTGIRASELLTLTLDRLHLNENEPYIDVIGKGRRRREVGLSGQARRNIHRYVTRFRTGKKDYSQVFISRRGQPMTPYGLDQMLYRLRDWAGITGVRVSAHTFRHTFAVHYLLSGGDIYLLSRILGHTNVSTTEIYLRAVKMQQVRKVQFSLLEEL